MRLSTQGAFSRGLGLMQQLQSALDHTQRQISSGRRILTPSDDPIAAARTLDLQESIAVLNQYERNGDNARNRLSFEETALGNVNNALQRVRELALQANNASQSNESRRQIATEMREQLGSLLQLANQKDGSGRYLFAGNMDETEPVSRSGGVYSYNGDQGQRLLQISDGRQIPDGDPGSDVFFRVKNGNGVFSVNASTTNTGTGVLGDSSVTDQTAYGQQQFTVRFIDPTNYEILDAAAVVVGTGTYESGESVAISGIQFSITGDPAAGDEFNVLPSANNNIFGMIDSLAAAVESIVQDDTSRAEMSNGINTGILAIDQALGNVVEVRTLVGSRLAAIDAQEDSNSATVIALQETIADLGDLDYAEAISRLSIQASTLEAAQQSFVRTQSLSLFNYL